LANPVQPLATALGVANAQVAPLMAAEMASRGRNALVFRGRDGLDELSTTEINDIWQVSGGEVRQSTLDAARLGLKPAKLEFLIGGDAAHNAQVARDLFSGKTSGNLSWVKDIVLLNAAGGVVSYRLAKDPSLVELDLESQFAGSLALVTETLESGAAEAKLSQWVEASNAI
jgi:anthranilate phosphoribosyltransferase